jgi:hypothetical protein
MLGIVGGKEGWQCDPRDSQLSGKPCTEGFTYNNFCTLPAPIPPARAVRYVFLRQDTTKMFLQDYMSHLGGGACIVMTMWRRGKYGRISGGTRVLELAADSREATIGCGARSTSTSVLTSTRPKGGSKTTTARRTVAIGEAARSGGGVILMSSRRRKTRYGGFE